MAEMLLFKCTDITDPFIKSPKIPKIPRPGEPLTYTNLFILQLMKQRPKTLLELLQLIIIKLEWESGSPVLISSHSASIYLSSVGACSWDQL